MTGLVAGCASEPGLEVGPGEPDEVLGKADAAAGRAELKVTIAPADLRRARNRLSLQNDRSQTRRIWFFDTEALELYQAGTILRAREIDGDPDDSTVKLRPFTMAELAPAFRDLDELKCEVDRAPDAASPACSLKIEQAEDEIAEVGRGERDIDKLFSAEQEAMFAAYGPAVGWDQLTALGPIPARTWTIRTELLPEKVTAELWYMPDGSQTLELSMKVALADGDDGMTKLLDFVDDRGLSLADEQESKTQRALQAFVGAGR